MSCHAENHYPIRHDLLLFWEVSLASVEEAIYIAPAIHNDTATIQNPFCT